MIGQNACGGRYLMIVSHDSERFTIEGPADQFLSWIASVRHARDAGQNVDFRHISATQAGRVADWSKDSGYELWPSGSIVRPNRI
jgi:hypothetical protein